MTRFTPDRATYIRIHWTMAALAMALGMLTLWLIGNPHVWTGAVGGLAAVALRGWFLMDESLSQVWTLTGTHLDGPHDRRIPLAEIARTRAIGSAVQVITRDGHKHLIKFQKDAPATATRIDAARR